MGKKGQGPADSCTKQRRKVTISVEGDADSHCSPDCTKWKLCLSIDSDSPISHVCSAAYECGPFEWQRGQDFNVVTREYCQYVDAGDYAHFLLKDGNKCGDSYYAGELDHGAIALCQPSSSVSNGDYPAGEFPPTYFDGEGGTCSGNDEGVECVWSIKAPDEAPPSCEVVIEQGKLFSTALRAICCRHWFQMGSTF